MSAGAGASGLGVSPRGAGAALKRWPHLTTWLLCTPEQLAESLAGYIASGESTPSEVLALTCCMCHLAIASVLARAAGGHTMHDAITQAARLRVAAHTSASAHRRPGAP